LQNQSSANSGHDRLGRPLRNLRVSVTDRCNLRCGYCMPEEEYVWLPKQRLLTFEDIDLLVDVFLGLGTRRLRLTGGEPLLRRGLDGLVRRLAEKPGLEDLAMTTNGLRLDEQAQGLHDAGLDRLTISIDTLRPERYRELTRRDDLSSALAGIEAATAAGFGPVKLNTVVMRGVNDDELLDLLEFARAGGHELRFIEYMDVGGATHWNPETVVPRTEILERIQAHHGPVTAEPDQGSAPAQRFRLQDGSLFGIVASTTSPFCGSCDRARLTADGHLFTCLYAREGLDLFEPLRSGATPAELAELVTARWAVREDRGAEKRLELASRGSLADVDELRDDPRLEMHTRGG